ncbi:hypothetical protein B0H17DRAFT_1140039 [Mycena rosella]|uniref:Uncharacterized protein n=1 Tax=Mycena rosella TaxID=1033263 RepID=A0AAD7GCD4_MYCRO|nr:hypothetical protein B0H17DRAFT_1140039 [Mycena rosella]
MVRQLLAIFNNLVFNLNPSHSVKFLDNQHGLHFYASDKRELYPDICPVKGVIKPTETHPKPPVKPPGAVQTRNRTPPYRANPRLHFLLAVLTTLFPVNRFRADLIQHHCQARWTSPPVATCITELPSVALPVEQVDEPEEELEEQQATPGEE